MQLKVAALCEILQGPTEIVNVVASADIIRYSVDKQIIDFGQQVSYFSISIITVHIFLNIINLLLECERTNNEMKN